MKNLVRFAWASALVLGLAVLPNDRAIAGPTIGDSTSVSLTKPGRNHGDDTSCVFAIDGVTNVGTDVVTISTSANAYVAFRCYFAYKTEILAGGSTPHAPLGGSGGFENTLVPGGGTATACVGCYKVSGFVWDEVLDLGDGQAFAEGHFLLGWFSGSRTISSVRVATICSTASGSTGSGCNNSKVGGGTCSIAWTSHGCALSMGGYSTADAGRATAVGDEAFAAGAFPGWHYGSYAYEGPVDACGTLDTEILVRRSGAGNEFESVTPLAVVQPGDIVRVVATSTELPVDSEHLEADESVVLSFRWSSSDPWSSGAQQLSRTYASDDWPEVSMTFVRLADDGPIGLAQIELRCFSTSTITYDYWSELGGWGGTGELAGCAVLTLQVVEFDILGDGSLLKAPFEWSSLLTDDALVEVSVGGDAPGVPVRLEYRMGEDPAWYELGTLAQDFDPPGTIQFGVGTHHSWAHPHEIEFRCTDAGGSHVRDPETDEFERDEAVSGEGASGESCYAQASSDMSLTSPASWVRGSGRMFVCLVTWLFVPDGAALAEEWGELETAAESHAPVSWLVNGWGVVDGFASGLPGAIAANEDECLRLMTPGSELGSAPPVDLCVADSMASSSLWTTMRPWIGDAVFALWAVSLLAVAGSIMNRGSAGSAVDEPYQLTLFDPR